MEEELESDQAMIDKASLEKGRRMMAEEIFSSICNEDFTHCLIGQVAWQKIMQILWRHLKDATQQENKYVK